MFCNHVLLCHISCLNCDHLKQIPINAKEKTNKEQKQTNKKKTIETMLLRIASVVSYFRKHIHLEVLNKHKKRDTNIYLLSCNK